MAQEMIAIETGGEVAIVEKTFGDVVDEWLKFLATKTSERKRTAKPRTLANYKYSIGVFKRWLDEQGVTIGQATEATISAWDKAMDTAGYSAATKNAYLAAVKSFFKWAAVKYSTRNIAAGIGCDPRSREHTRGFLDMPDMKNLLATVAVETQRKLDETTKKNQRERIILQGKRDRAILSVLMCAGLRSIEVSRLRVVDVGYDGGARMLNVQGKGKTESDRVTVKISNKVYRVIREWLDAREVVEGYAADDDAPLFCSLANSNFGDAISSMSVSRLCKEYLRAAGLKEKEYAATDDKGKKETVSKPITCHSLRASCATEAFRAGATLEQVQQQLRHANVQTTQIYLAESEKFKNPVSDIISDGIF